MNGPLLGEVRKRYSTTEMTFGYILIQHDATLIHFKRKKYHESALPNSCENEHYKITKKIYLFINILMTAT